MACAALYAARAYRPGDGVLEFAEVQWRTHRDRKVQHPAGGHIYRPVLAMTSHSCEPNCEIVIASRTLIARRPIAAGEPITFDHTRTESRFAHPFDCLCGSRRCRGRTG